MRAPCGTHGGITATSPGAWSGTPVELELELALEHGSDLLLLVHVRRRDGVRRERHEVEHHLLTEHRTELQPRDELGRLDVFFDCDEPPGPWRPTGLAAEMRLTADAGQAIGALSRRRARPGPTSRPGGW